MKRAITNLADFPDSRLFEEVAKGIPLIFQNAYALDTAAQKLHQERQFRVSDAVRRFSEEEAAKILILIDLIRCPSMPDRKAETAKFFYSHVAKRIYATTCSYPRIASFGELCNLIETESRPSYLDGPNQVDWIFLNSVVAEREQALYVDYVQDITEEFGSCFWRDPIQTPYETPEYKSPDCVKLGNALLEAGAGSLEGLTLIANLWRGFAPGPETDRAELQILIKHTLEKLAKIEKFSENQPSLSFIVSHWSFPLWSLTIKEPRAKSRDLDELRRERDHLIEWIEATDAKRDPPPVISRSKVEALSVAYAEWRREVDEQEADKIKGKERRIRFRSSSELIKSFELPSYKQIEEMFCELTEAESAALLALGWYGDSLGVTDWPKTYERAIQYVETSNKNYQIGYGHRWLDGLKRWETKPRPFDAGRLYHR